MPHRPRGLALADNLTAGRVAESLRTWSRAGVSNPAIARLLAQTYGVVVTGETVRRWLLALKDDNGDESSAA